MRAAEARLRKLLTEAVMISLAACDAHGDECAPRKLATIDDAGADCASFISLPCGVPDGASVTDCFPDLASCAKMCGPIFYCQITPDSCSLDAGVGDAPITVECITCYGGGRRTRTLESARAAGRTELGAFFAALGHIESASVRAFVDLATWLAEARAPARFVRAARRAARDEIRHARAMRRIAQRHGGETCRVRHRAAVDVQVARRHWPRASAAVPRAFATWIEENAIEGCARETFGAIVATWQSTRATCPRLRATMKRIARDETRHAALAWEILHWGMAKLAPRESARVRRTLHRELAALPTRVPRLSATTLRTAGLPSARERNVLARSLRAVATRELARY
jgi:hypothetical protein